MKSDIEIYCDCIAEVRVRLNVVDGFINGSLTTGFEVCNVETVFLQLRKILELIAFASLTANKSVYSAAHKNFSKHWNAKKMLGDLQKVNPDFYPTPLDPPQETAPGVKHFTSPTDGFMTATEFVSLYEAASEIIHTRNPFSTQVSLTQIVYPVHEWVLRIRQLLAWHLMHLINGGKWIVNVPTEGDVQTWPAERLSVAAPVSEGA